MPSAPGSHNQNLENSLEQLPDQVADALQRWRIATLEREKEEALLYLKFKGSDQKRTSEEIKALVRSDGSRYTAVLKEVTSESDYIRLSERLMGFKKLASLRTQF